MAVICYLKDLMDAQELSQLELREKTGLATSTIGRLYRNQVTRIDIDTVETLMKYFGLNTISQLIEVKPE
ncbi:MAG: helix-turn-helix transcriptional regulator [Cyanobacteriota bacterium]|jgi:DNA-binding Xre family transcriptional regulator|nr:helix-turn-helix transcriptional regulator [Cyanobacteriota bacterium]